METRSHDLTARVPAAMKPSMIAYGVAWFITTGLATWTLVLAGATP